MSVFHSFNGSWFEFDFTLPILSHCHPPSCISAVRLPNKAHQRSKNGGFGAVRGIAPRKRRGDRETLLPTHYWTSRSGRYKAHAGPTKRVIREAAVYPFCASQRQTKGRVIPRTDQVLELDVTGGGGAFKILQFFRQICGVNRHPLTENVFNVAVRLGFSTSFLVATI